MDEDFVDEYWEDREATKKLTGSFANRIYVQPLGDGMLRINFGEVLDAEPSYHSAIVTTAAQAVGFAQLIYQIATSAVAAERQAAVVAAEAAAKFAEEQTGAAAEDIARGPSADRTA